MQAARPHGLALVWLLLPWEVYSALRMVGVRDGPPIITRAFRLVDQGRAVLEFGAHLKGIGWHQLGRTRARERSEPYTANPLVHSTCMPDHSAHAGWRDAFGLALSPLTFSFICKREQGGGGSRKTSIGVPIANTGRPSTAASMGPNARIQQDPPAYVCVCVCVLRTSCTGVHTHNTHLC